MKKLAIFFILMALTSNAFAMSFNPNSKLNKCLSYVSRSNWVAVISDEEGIGEKMKGENYACNCNLYPVKNTSGYNTPEICEAADQEWYEQNKNNF